MGTPRAFLGDFEQRVLLAILRCGDPAFALDVRRELERITGQDVSRGAFYTTLDRLDAKGLARWTAARGSAARDGLPQRSYKVTPAGLRALRASRQSLIALWQGLEGALDEG